MPDFFSGATGFHGAPGVAVNRTFHLGTNGDGKLDAVEFLLVPIEQADGTAVE